MTARTPASVRARRLLAILHLFEPDADVPLADIADALGISTADAAEDLGVLACCGLHPYTPDTLIPLYLEDGVVRVFGELPALERAVRLSSREARALAAALELAGVPADAPLMRKLLDGVATPDVSSEEVTRLLTVAPGAAVGGALGELAVARDGRRCVSLTYQAAGRDVPTDRVVEPLALVHDQGAWYLEAYCRRAGALRTFRVDRIRALAVLDEVFSPRDVSPSGTALLTDGLPLARVRFGPTADDAARTALREWPGAQIDTRDAGGTTVLVLYAGTAWLARQVVASLGQAEVLEPAEVRRSVRELALRELDALGADRS